MSKSLERKIQRLKKFDIKINGLLKKSYLLEDEKENYISEKIIEGLGLIGKCVRINPDPTDCFNQVTTYMKIKEVDLTNKGKDLIITGCLFSWIVDKTDPENTSAHFFGDNQYIYSGQESDDVVNFLEQRVTRIYKEEFGTVFSAMTNDIRDFLKTNILTK
jgi:hypothetical protein